MASKRMFSLDIVDSDAFVSMPLSTQALYFHLSMRADDDGFVKNPKRIQRDIGSNDDDMKVLIAKRFILPFDSGIVVIKHWKINNTIRADRYKPTTYLEEKATLTVKENGAYTEAKKVGIPLGIPNDNQVGDSWLPQYSIGKSSIDKVSLVEGSVVDGDTAATTEENQLKQLNGPLGQGVVWLSDNQIASLLDEIGLEAFDRYVYFVQHYSSLLNETVALDDLLIVGRSVSVPPLSFAPPEQSCIVG